MAPRSKKETPPKRPADVTAGALPSEALEGDFPPIALPVHPPFPPMEARSAERIPGGGWLYEPKWDGFRCLAFRKGKEVLLQSKACQPLGRYFPELIEALAALPGSRSSAPRGSTASWPSGSKPATSRATAAA
jgi:ATP-dependent DNA ligase